MNLFSRLLQRGLPQLTHIGQSVQGHPEPACSEQAVERVLDLHPHLRQARGAKARLQPAVAQALGYVGQLLAAVPPAREASARVWAEDAYIRAFFASADEVARVLSRSAELRAQFERNPRLQEAYAVLGMEMNERHILGVGLVGDKLRHDVQKTTLSFADHQLRMCGDSEQGLREEIQRRLIEQLALEGLAQAGAEKSRREVLQREHALLATRLQLLQQRGAGLRGVVGGEAAPDQAGLARLQAELESNEAELARLGLASVGMERELQSLERVLAQPAPHLQLFSRRVKLDRANVLIEPGSEEAGSEIEFQFARIPTTPPRTRAFCLVRFARQDLLPAKNMLDEAERLL